MHKETTYSFHGDAPITGLTPHEVDLLMLGHLVHSEQAENAVKADGEDPDLRKRKQELQRGHQQARREQFSDLGFQ